MKKILYIHQYFHTPEQPGGTRSYWLAQELIKNGYEVIMLTTNSKQTEKIRTYDADGIKVISYGVFYSQSMGIRGRLQSFTDFMVKSVRYVLKHSREYDIVFATSTPLTVGVPALFAKWFKKKKYIFEVRDLWPEVPIQMGAFKNPLIIRLTRWLEKTIYKNAEHVIALSPGMQDGIVKYIPKEKTSMIPNMSKIDKFWPREKNEILRSEMGLKQVSFKIIHFGALGIANGAHTIIDAAILMKDDSSVEFIFVGGGSQESTLKNICKKNNLTNVKFYRKVPMQEMSEIVNLCDVSITSFKDLPILYTNSPNKLFDSLSAGKPIIVNSAGWTRDMVEEYNCGYYVNPNKPQELVDKIKYLQLHPNITQEMGKNSRKLAETIYDKSILCEQFSSVIKNLRLY